MYSSRIELDLKELKERAREVRGLLVVCDFMSLILGPSQHIVKSLTVTNVSHEVFSSFSAAFEEIRKVQIDFFLANWWVLGMLLVPVANLTKKATGERFVVRMRCKEYGNRYGMEDILGLKRSGR